MALTTKEATIIRGSIPTLREQGERVTRTFYSNLIASNPELNNIFNTVNQVSGKQPRALCSVMLAYASNIQHMSEIVPRLERMAQKHCSLGIRPDQYQLVGKYLLQAFALVLGSEWSSELQVAWGKAYSMLAKMLIARESQLYRDFGDWKGWRRFRIQDVLPESDEMCSFYLVPCDGGSIPAYMPGQYISIRVPVPKLGFYQQRQYSLSDSFNPDHYRISVQRCRAAKGYAEGTVSNLLIRNKRAGDIIEATHPAGEFYLTPGATNTPLVLISAGSGATPLVAMLNAIVDRHEIRPISWIHCSPRKAPFEDHVKRIASERRDFSFKFFRSQMTELDAQALREGDELGRMDLATVGLEKLYLNHTGTEYFICGPEALMKDISRFLYVQGVNRSNVRCELFETGEFHAEY
jgi:nitric oxide dioxygenase